MLKRTKCLGSLVVLMAIGGLAFASVSTAKLKLPFPAAYPGTQFELYEPTSRYPALELASERKVRDNALREIRFQRPVFPKAKLYIFDINALCSSAYSSSSRPRVFWNAQRLKKKRNYTWWMCSVPTYFVERSRSNSDQSSLRICDFNQYVLTKLKRRAAGKRIIPGPKQMECGLSRDFIDRWNENGPPYYKPRVSKRSKYRVLKKRFARPSKLKDDPVVGLSPKSGKPSSKPLGPLPRPGLRSMSASASGAPPGWSEYGCTDWYVHPNYRQYWVYHCTWGQPIPDICFRFGARCDNLRPPIYVEHYFWTGQYNRRGEAISQMYAAVYGNL